MQLFVSEQVGALGRRVVLLLVAALVVFVGVGVAAGQDAGDRFEPGDLDVGDAAAGVSEVELRVVRLGPGGLARRGDWAGILVELRDRGLQQREVVLRARVEDRDGDDALYERVVASNPGFAQSFWLYARLPAGGRGVSLSAHAAVETPVSEADPAGLRGFATGEMLARVEVDATRASATGESLYGVIGPAGFGVRQYAADMGTAGERASPAGHEPTRVAVGMSVQELPDRWQGLAPVEVLVWGGGSDQSPAGLSVDQARALREWIARGGHLVVVLRAAEGVWLSEADNPVFNAMPMVDPPLVREGVDLRRYRALLTTDASAELPRSAVVRSFRRAPGAGSQAAMPILEGPGGDVVVVRRLIGSGAVTLVGLDLGDAELRSLGLPAAEAFWHRVLGRRGPVLSGSAELVEVLGEDAARAAGRRDPAVFDGDIENQIDTARRAAAGVLLGFFVFGAYWLIAGPVGYWLLSRSGLKRHAWLGFAGAAGVFTAIAWGGATAIRPSEIEAQHLTLLEQVHGQPVQRARGWASVLVPWYGRATVAVEDGEYSAGVADELGLRRWHDLLAPWSPTAGGGLVGGFPDNRGYRVEARAPDSASVPARSTVKQFRFDWAGAARWGMPQPVGLPGQTDVPVLTARDDGSVDGVLRHTLPGDRAVSRGDAWRGEPRCVVDGAHEQAC
ncbi:MAG: hypothetical protein AAF297_07150 [Planctomycetota bacterium]